MEMAVKEAAKASPIDTNKAIKNFYLDRLLCRVFSEEKPAFILKGGQSMLAYVLDTELARERTVASRRNLGSYSLEVFFIPYMVPNGRQALHLDFIFFAREENGDIRFGIIDPHSTYLAEVAPRLKGYVECTREPSDVFVQILSVGTLAGSDGCRMLDFKREDVQQAIMDFGGDYGEDLHRGHLSSLYGRSGEIVAD